MFLNFLPFIFLLLSGIACTKKVDYTEKTLFMISEAEIKGFDPIQSQDTYAAKEIGKVYEGLLEFHYLKRPYVLSPNLAEEMPSVSADGLTYTFKLRKDVNFHDDAAFKGGEGRQMIAKDVVYSIMRLADFHNQSPGWWLLDNKIVGLNEWRDKYSKASQSNYTDIVEGLKSLDNFTVQFKLKKAVPQFLYSLAMAFTFVVPQEVVEKYGKEFLNHPVGTGPFTTTPFTQQKQITYVKNKKYRKKYFPTEGEAGDAEKGFLKDAGKELPLVDKIVTYVQTEAQPRWLGFVAANYDYIEVPKDNFGNVIDTNLGIQKEYQEKGIELILNPDMDVTYHAFNHEDPLFKNNKKLRQAMSLAYDNVQANKLFYHEIGVIAQGAIPPGMGGYDEKMVNPYQQRNIEKAKLLLAEAGYPGGKGLPKLTYEHKADTLARQVAEFYAKCMSDIGVIVQPNANTWPELLEKIDKRKAQIFGISWIGDYPDAENFLQLFYGPNSAPGANGANYQNAQFDALFEKATIMQDGPERNKLYAELNNILVEDAPWVFGVHRKRVVVKHSWLKNYKYTAYPYGIEMYFDVDLDRKKELSSKF